MKSKIANSISSVLIISVAIIFAIGSTDEGVPAKTVDTSLNETVTTPTVEFTFTSVEATRTVGGEFLKETAGEGATYIAVTYKYKNIGKKALGMWEKPSLTLHDAEGNEFDSDIGASVAFASRGEDDAKVISDLNPGLTANDSEVWEISEEFFLNGGWYIVAEAGDKIKIQLN